MSVKCEIEPRSRMEPAGDGRREFYPVLFHGQELSYVDRSEIGIVMTDADTLATRKAKLVAAAIAEWNAVRAIHGGAAATADLIGPRVFGPVVDRVG